MQEPTAHSVTQDTLTLAAESFGSPEDPPLLLVMGATASMLGWPDAFCRTLAAQGLRVIRFDHRDTGGSTTLPPGEASYTVETLAGDILTLLDAFELPRAPVVGMSLGGYLAQMAALRWPGRVASLTLIASEPLGWDGPDLPGLSEAFLSHFGALGTLDWTDRTAVAAFLLETERLCAGADFDAEAEATRVDRVLARTRSPASMFNHATLSVIEDWTGAFRRIDCPTLVIHGDSDPILPLPNGEALAEGIPDAELMVLPDTGHCLPERHHAAIARRIAAQIRGL